MAHMTIKTTGLRCGSCDKRVELELEDIEGVTAVKSDHETGLVEVDYDDACNTARFQPAIEGLDPDFKVIG